ncbi:MAG: hypothetical protein MZV63_15935 [Marinilabiliales bacterium]|nr:hypothetical protein [Marinilabiliales bacterium]
MRFSNEFGRAPLTLASARDRPIGRRQRHRRRDGPRADVRRAGRRRSIPEGARAGLRSARVRPARRCRIWR